MIERRESRRRRSAEIGVEAPLDEVRLVDISASGMAIDTATPLGPGVEVPLVVASNGRRGTVEGVVRWCRLIETKRLPGGDVRPIYRAGIAFAENLASEPRAAESEFEREVGTAIDRWLRRSTGRALLREI